MFKKIKPKEQECCSVEFEEKNDSKDNKEDNNNQSNELRYSNFYLICFSFNTKTPSKFSLF